MGNLQHADGCVFKHTPNPEVCPCTGPKECKHENTTYDPGNYLPPFGWEQHPGMFCDECGEEIEQEDITEDLFWGDDEDTTPSRYELEEEARNPL
jgi:hypothetical protein